MCNDVTPYIIFDDMFTNYKNWDCVGKVIDVYAKGEIVKIIKFLAQNARRKKLSGRQTEIYKMTFE